MGQWSLQADHLGWRSCSAEVAWPLDGHTLAGGGLGWRRGRLGMLILEMLGPGAGARLQIPVRQPMARPYGPEWQCFMILPGIRDVEMMARLEWRSGSLPTLGLTAAHRQVGVGLGSGGIWLAWTGRGQGARPWRCIVGVFRGNVPWSGVDWGPARGLGPDPGACWPNRPTLP